MTPERNECIPSDMFVEQQRTNAICPKHAMGCMQDVLMIPGRKTGISVQKVHVLGESARWGSHPTKRWKTNAIVMDGKAMKTFVFAGQDFGRRNVSTRVQVGKWL